MILDNNYLKISDFSTVGYTRFLNGCVNNIFSVNYLVVSLKCFIFAIAFCKECKTYCSIAPRNNHLERNRA